MKAPRYLTDLERDTYLASQSVSLGIAYERQELEVARSKVARLTENLVDLEHRLRSAALRARRARMPRTHSYLDDSGPLPLGADGPPLDIHEPPLEEDGPPLGCAVELAAERPRIDPVVAESLRLYGLAPKPSLATPATNDAALERAAKLGALVALLK